MENKDMNLFDFFILCWHKIVGLFKWIGIVFLRTVRLCLQYIWIVLPMAILGLLGGWLWSKEKYTKYHGNATILYAEGMKEIVEEGIIDFINLPNEIKEKEYGISIDLSRKFDKLLKYNVIDAYPFDSMPDFIDRDHDIAVKDTMNRIMKDRTHLVLKLDGTQDFYPYQHALESYFRNSAYAIRADKRCKDIRQEKLEHVKKEYARLDSFSNYDYFLRPRYLGAERGNLIISEREQELYYEDLLFVSRYKEYLENQILETPEVINFQTNFVAYAMPGIYKYAIGLIFGSVLGMLISLLIKYRKIILGYLKKH